MTDERQLKALRLLQENPALTQRALALNLGVSLGAANYCLKALGDKGWIKLGNYQKSTNKLGYLYLLTPNGIAAKSRLTRHFLGRKIAEYESLGDEIRSLKSETNQRS